MIIEFFFWTVAVTLYFLIDASLSDLKTNEVQNKVWKMLLTILSPFVIVNIYENPIHAIDILKTLAVTTCVGYSLFKIGLFGGADIKMVMVLSVIYPLNSYIMVLVLLLSLIMSFPLLLLISYKNKNKKEEDKIVHIPFIPIISISFFLVLYLYYINNFI